MEQVDQLAVKREVEREFSALRDKSEDDLRVVIGTFVLGAELFNEENFVSREEFIDAGNAVAKRGNVREIVCDPENRHLIGDALTIENVSSLVLVLLGIFNVTVVAVGIIALAVLLLKITLNEYCKVTTNE